MSISKIQRKRKIKEFAETLVKKGIEPNNYELNNMLQEHFDNHIMGMPYYSPIKQEPYEESSKDDYNHNFLTFKEDIDAVYEANIETNNKAVAIQEYYDTERTKVTHAIDKVALRVENLEDALKNNKRIQEHVEAFDDLYNIELYGNEDRNIPYTTSFIDLLQKRVYTEKINAQVNKLSMQNASVTMTGMDEFGGYSSSGELQKVLDDTINDIFIFTGQTSENEQKSINLIIDLGGLVSLNTVLFKSTSSNNMTFTLALSEDGNNFFTVFDIIGKDLVEWNFDTKSVRYLKITCTKREADGQAVNNQGFNVYEYYFIIKNITIALEEFESQSIVVTKPIEFDNLTNFIKLDATDTSYSDTRINYFIGFDNGSDKIGWDSINNHDEHLLFMFEKQHKIANFGTYDWYGSQSLVTKLYRIFRLPDGINRNSLKVVPGYNMWSVKKYNRLDGDYDDGFDLKDSDVTEFIKNCTVTNMFMDCENYDKFPIKSNTLYIFTQYVNCPQSVNLLNKKAIVSSRSQLNIGETPGDSYTYKETDAVVRIFVNGYEQIASEKGEYTFSFKKGTNKIQMAVYYPNSIVTEGQLEHNINLKEITNDVFALPPMKYTNQNMLSKSLDPGYKYYTIKNNIVYINIDPAEMITDFSNDMGFFISYYSLKPDMQRYFHADKIKFRIMAILNSKNKNVSPSISSIRLTGK